MRIENSNSYLYGNHFVVGQKAMKNNEEIKSEIIPPEMKNQQPAEETMEKLQNDNTAYLEAINQQLETSGKQTKAEKEKLKVLLTCLEISRRIIGGNKVPSADHQYLMKHDLALYARSIAMRFPKNNPYEYKQLSEEDKLQDDWQIHVAQNHQLLKGSLVNVSGAILNVKK